MTPKVEIEQIMHDAELSDFYWIKAEDIVVSQWVRVKCTFGCSDYGLGTCPPNTPSVEDCRSFFNEYSTALLIRFTKLADKEAYPSAWSKEITGKLMEAERKIFLKDHPKVFLFNQTCCGLCSDCSGDRLHCKDKQRSRPSPEAFAVDVYQTVKNAGLDLHVVSTNPGEMNRIALLMID